MLHRWFDPWVTLVVAAVCMWLIAPAATDQPTDLKYTITPVPEGTAIKASFGCEDGKGPEVLLDGNPATVMTRRGNTAGGRTSLFLRFSKPMSDLAWIRTGKSDPFKNYYPQEMQFYVDTTGDGKYAT